MNDSIFRDLAEAEEKRIPTWTATIIAVEGFTPGKPGMKMSMRGDGRRRGTVGGGEVERQVIERILREKPALPAKWRYDLGMDDVLVGAESTGMVCGGYLELFIEPLFGGAPLYIFGGGHCGMALSEIAAPCGFRVLVVDDRPEWSSSEKHPRAAGCLCAPFTQLLPYVEFSPEVFLVIMTYGHRSDEVVLRQCLGKEYKYLGMLGSRKKAGEVLARLREEGISEQVLETIHTPIGLPIGSATPEEIAISILAQLIAVKNKKLP